jgi:hypothetical protein
MTDPGDPLLSQRIRTMQLIAGALLMGVLSFLGVALFLVYVQQNGKGMVPPQGMSIYSLVALGMFAVCASLSIYLPRNMLESQTRRIAAGLWQPPPGQDASAYASQAAQLLAARQSTMIIGLALLEASAFMGILAFLIEGNPLALCMTAGAVVLMLFRFPLNGRIRAWLEEQSEITAQSRQREPGQESV